jgi:hypothetical protein
MLQHLGKTIDSELTENKRMENAKTPMSARIVAKTSRPSGPPSAIAKSSGTAHHQQNLTHIRVNDPIRATPTTIPRTQKPHSWTQNPETKQSNKGKKPLQRWKRAKMRLPARIPLANSPMSWLQRSAAIL